MTPTDLAWNHRPRTNRPRVAVERTSRFLTMRDGTRIALDVTVPRGATRAPAIVRQTRYLRALETPRLVSMLGLQDEFDTHAAIRRRFLAEGYAWVDVDVRGTGASTGVWRTPWFDDQVRDGSEVVDFIVRQSWSSGRVGALGVSYDGTCAEMLLVAQHPAVRAVAPLFSLYDVFADVGFPGGVHLSWFTAAWARYNACLDRNEFHQAMVTPLRLMARAASLHPAPDRRARVMGRLGAVDDDTFRTVASALLRRLASGVKHVERVGDGAPTPAQLVERAANLDVHTGALRVRFRDDVGVHPDMHDQMVDSFSPHTYRDRIEGSGAAIYGYSGWRDAAYPNAAIKRFRSVRTPGSRLTLGPWAHTGRLRIHAFGLGQESCFDHATELLGFFDEHLRDGPKITEHERVHYFTLGEERWKSAPTWPPPGTEPRTLHVDRERSLSTAVPATDGHDDYVAEPTIASGERSRWRSLLSLVPGDYPDRKRRDAELLVYDGRPLDRDLEVTGHPIVIAHVAFDDAQDCDLFAYLEDVRPDGEVGYVTEGQLRAVHRASKGVDDETGVPVRSFRRDDALEVAVHEPLELHFELLPVSYLFRRGHRVRIAFARGDADHFTAPRRRGGFRLFFGPGRSSRLILPTLTSRASSSRAG